MFSELELSEGGRRRVSTKDRLAGGELGNVSENRPRLDTDVPLPFRVCVFLISSTERNEGENPFKAEALAVYGV